MKDILFPLKLREISIETRRNHQTNYKKKINFKNKLIEHYCYYHINKNTTVSVKITVKTVEIGHNIMY